MIASLHSKGKPEDNHLHAWFQTELTVAKGQINQQVCPVHGTEDTVLLHHKLIRGIIPWSGETQPRVSFHINYYKDFVKM